MTGEAALEVAVLFACALLVVHYGSRFVIGYRLAEKAFEVRFFGIRWMRIPYGDIVEVRVINAIEAFLPHTAEMFNAARAGDRLFARRAVVIRRRSGLPKAMVVTPNDPEAFVAELERRLRDGALASA